MAYHYGRIKKLSESLIANGVPRDKYEIIMKDGELIRQADKNSIKANWFVSAMKAMDKVLDDELKKKVREGCACCLGGRRNTICKKINKDYLTLTERVEAANESKFVFGNGVKTIGDGKYEVSFFQEDDAIKVCPCLKDLREKMPITYCYCCRGHVRHHLETVLGNKLRVKVVSSVLSSMGKKGCKFELIEI
jgi:hypothetical protein